MMKRLLAAVSLSSLGLLLGASVVMAGGGGGHKGSTTIIKNSNSTYVSQSNTASFGNGVGVTSSTGNNKASKNTKGDVTITSGDSTVNISVNNAANSNTADVNSCCCDKGPVDPPTVDSETNHNTVIISNCCKVTVKQSNVALIENTVQVSTSTGGNTADKNTDGDVKVTSGDSDVTINIDNAANSNSLTIN